jgi:hypothetical protein
MSYLNSKLFPVAIYRTRPSITRLVLTDRIIQTGAVGSACYDGAIRCFELAYFIA